MKTPAQQTINLAAELRSGHHFGVFIDDTGSPGLNTPGLHSKRKSWVAVLVPPHQIIEVMDQLPKALLALKEFGLKDPEFHFTDIWAGKGDYKKLTLQQRISIFEFMAHIFEIYRFQVLVQTFDPDNAAELLNHDSAADWPANLGPLKLSSHEDLALIFVLSRIHMHLKSLEGGNASACVIVDEGRLAHGSAIVLSGFEPTFCAGVIFFANSRITKPLQLADFAAFAMNRSQLLRVKDPLGDLDKKFLKILSPIAECFINIDQIKIHNADCITNLRQGMN